MSSIFFGFFHSLKSNFNCFIPYPTYMEALKNLFHHVRSVAFDPAVKRLSIGEFILAGSIISIPVMLGLLLLALIARITNSYNIYMYGSLVVSIWFLCYWIPVAIKRCNDINWSKHMLWLLLVPFVNLYIAFTLLLKRGDEKENSFGEDPRKKQEPGNENYWKLWWLLLIASIIGNMAVSHLMKPLVIQQTWGMMRWSWTTMKGWKTNLWPICKQTFAILDCLVEKSPDTLKATYRQWLTSIQQLEPTLGTEKLETVCNSVLTNYKGAQKSMIEGYWCKVE